MKVLKGIIICTIAGILLQNSIFLYVEKIYLLGNNHYNIEKVDNSDGEESLEFNINDRGEDVRLSFDGKYVSYMLGDKLEIYNSKKGDTKKYKEVTGKLVYYKWLTDCNKMIVIEKIVKNGETYFVPISYDGKTGQANEITDFDMKEIKIKAEDSDSQVDTVEFSTASSSLYIKINNENGKSNLYYANQMNQLEKVKSNADIKEVAVPITSTNAIMKMGNKICVLNEADNIKVPKAENPKILGTDKNDKVYFCDDNNGKTDTIYYANANEKKYKWSKIKLKSEEDIDNIYIEYSGKVYINYPEDKVVKEITKNKEIKYKGKFLQAYRDGIVSKDDNKVMKKILEK